MNINSDNNPIIIGLCGKAGTGKTSVANIIVPSHTIKYDKENKTIWDHTFFALPLYEMASIKRITKGEKQKERILFQLHEVLFDVFGNSPLYGAPDYDNFISLVKEIESLPMPISDEIKPRDFLQKAGELCRDENEDCFTQWARRKAYQRCSSLLNDQEEEGFYETYISIISDVRYRNEAEMIKAMPNGILIRFDASDEIRSDRLYKRDGYRMSEEQRTHKSEQVELIPETLLNAIINTDTMTAEQQAQETIRTIQKEINRVYA